MDYRDQLISRIERYFKEVIEPYNKTTTSAMKDCKKPGLFKKVDFSGHIENFKKHDLDARTILRSPQADIPEDDDESRKLEDAFEESVHDFCELCETNIRFYDISDRKQYRDSGIKASDFKMAFNVTQSALIDSIKSLDKLDKSYRKYIGEPVEEKSQEPADE